MTKYFVWFLIYASGIFSIIQDFISSSSGIYTSIDALFLFMYCETNKTCIHHKIIRLMIIFIRFFISYISHKYLYLIITYIPEFRTSGPCNISHKYLYPIITLYFWIWNFRSMIFHIFGTFSYFHFFSFGQSCLCLLLMTYLYVRSSFNHVILLSKFLSTI